jgi:hypothetical protein
MQKGEQRHTVTAGIPTRQLLQWSRQAVIIDRSRSGNGGGVAGYRVRESEEFHFLR